MAAVVHAPAPPCEIDSPSARRWQKSHHSITQSKSSTGIQRRPGNAWGDDGAGMLRVEHRWAASSRPISWFCQPRQKYQKYQWPVISNTSAVFEV
jgi:hypothetical protein